MPSPIAAAALLLAALLAAAALPRPAAAWHVYGTVFCDACRSGDGPLDAAAGDALVVGATLQTWCVVGSKPTGVTYSGATDRNGHFSVSFDEAAPVAADFGGCFVQLVGGPPGGSCSIVGSCNGGDAGKLITDASGSWHISSKGYNGGAFCLQPPTVAPSCPAPPGVKGDPHFQGADGVAFDFTGKPDTDYCLLSDATVHINAHFVGHTEVDKTYTWIKAIGVLAGGHTLEMVARPGAEAARGAGGYIAAIRLDGADVGPPLADADGSAATPDGALSVRYLGHAVDGGGDDVDRYDVAVAGVARFLLKLRPEVPALRKLTDAFVHFSIETLSMPGLSALPHGILGQTFRAAAARGGGGGSVALVDREWSDVLGLWQVAGPDAESYLDGAPADYEASALLAPDCAFSRFRLLARPGSNGLPGVGSLRGEPVLASRTASAGKPLLEGHPLRR